MADDVVLQKQGPVTLLASAAPNRDGVLDLKLSDSLVLTLTVEGPAALTVEPPDKLVEAPGWRVLRSPKAEQTEPAPGRVLWRRTVELTPLRPGDLPLTPAPLRSRESDDAEWATVEWQPIRARVTTDVLRPDPQELHDVASIEELPPPPAWPYWPALAALAVLAAALLAVRRRRRRKPAPPLSPAAWALRELDAVAAQGLPAAGAFERYHTLVADVVRQYLERHLQFAAPRQTTAEFLLSLAKADQLGDEPRRLLGELLGRCDLAKFARAEPSPAECEHVLALARRLIEQTLDCAGPEAQAT